MKILVLGNGFDLEHSLPTSYKHFLNSCGHLVYHENILGYIYRKVINVKVKLYSYLILNVVEEGLCRNV